MPAADSDLRSRGGRLLPVLFWLGVGLAPVAGLLLLLGNGDTALRVAAALAVLAVVLIGLSVALRPDAESVRLEMEETLLDEIDMLREDMREDIATAARATHQGLGERLQALQQAVDTMRGELDAVKQAGPPPGPPPGRVGVAGAPAPQSAGPAVAHAAVAPPASGVPGGVYGASAVPDLGRTMPESAPPEPGRARVPTGVFQHTETVQVTTRSSTYMDRPPDLGERSRVYGGGRRRDDGDYGGGRRRADGPRRDEGDLDAQSWSGPPAPRRPVEADDESWTDRRLRERYGRGGPDLEDSGEWPSGASAPPYRGRQERSAEPSRGGRRRAPEPEWPDQRDDFGPYPGVHTGDRWAEVRDDGRGRELRLGERRTSVSSTDTGSQVRIEDRWAAVRREDAAGRADYGRRALPATPSEPTWDEGWSPPARERVREPRGRRRRGEDLDDFSYPATGSQRRIDYELSDERWR